MKRDRFLTVHCGHNASCAVMDGGAVVVAAQEERFSRRKNDVGYPKLAIDYCMKKAGLRGSDLSAAAYSSLSWYSLFLKAKHSINFTIKDYIDYYGDKFYRRKFGGEDCLDYLRWLRDDEKFNKTDPYFDFSYLTDDVLRDSSKDGELFRKESVRMLSRQIGIPEEKVLFLDHHTCHAYYAYFASPFRGQDCIVLTMDGFGDGRNQTVWKAKNDTLELIAESDQNDIARLYKLATLILGMRPDEHEYKVMGLAPYAKHSYTLTSLAPIRDVLCVDGMRVVHKNRPADLFSFLKNAWEGHRFDNIAGAVQLYTEDLARQLIKNIHKETGISRFVMSGGVSMNVKMNKAIADLPCVSSLFVCASGGDESVSIGACYYLNRKNGDNRPLSTMYLGYDIDDDAAAFDWETVAGAYTIRRGVSGAYVAKLLAKGDVVARVCGRAEFGARALGNRSILADPSRRDVVKKINEAIKNRDFWMPFALSILEDRADEYISNPKKLKAPFMTMAFDTLPGLYDKIHAGTHPYDKTVRPQYVSKKDAPGYYDLIDEFRKVTGIPALLNTSFNLHGEPIVNNMNDALRTFKLSGLDHLLAGDALVSKKK